MDYFITTIEICFESSRKESVIGKLFSICLLNKCYFQVLWLIHTNVLLRWYSFSEESWWIPDSCTYSSCPRGHFKGQGKTVFKNTLKCYQALFITFSSICPFCSSHCNKDVDKSLYQTSFVLLLYYSSKACFWPLPTFLGVDLSSDVAGPCFVVLKWGILEPPSRQTWGCSQSELVRVSCPEMTWSQARLGIACPCAQQPALGLVKVSETCLQSHL